MASDELRHLARAWIQAVRDALVANEYVDGVHIGKLYFTGLPQEQMDGAHDTFEALPKLVGATLCIVGAVLLVSFRSLLVPIRAALCLIWMLVITFGSALLVYQVIDLDCTLIAPDCTPDCSCTRCERRSD